MKDAGDYVTMRERYKRVKNPGAYVTDCVSRGRFSLALYSFGLPSRILVVITRRAVGCRYMMRWDKH